MSPPLNIVINFGVWVLAYVRGECTPYSDCLPDMCEALGSIPTTAATHTYTLDLLVFELRNLGKGCKDLSLFSWSSTVLDLTVCDPFCERFFFGGGGIA